ncbi:MAG: alcohol dehydrogenase catalytic domain-containing protein [Anaerolineae bacterium]|nr:alcohol dehydrogenase catalytic domain-containing protein [Anaerolineae bacterium]
MSDKLTKYVRADDTPLDNRLWPLYGAGFNNLGVDGQPITKPLPAFGEDELLVRHDACGICFSDIKVINAGEQHPRIFRDMKADPVVLGHEIALTVAGVGDNLRDQYQIGDRFIVQADIYYQGVNYAYGYMIQGGMSQYAVIDHRILNGDDGNYLIPVQSATGYAESALAEPWACVIATYQLRYRTALKPGGSAWIIGTPQAGEAYTISAGFDESAHPTRLALTNVPTPFADWLTAQAERLDIELFDIPLKSLSQSEADLPGFDDIIVLGPDADIIEAASPHLADFGILAIIGSESLARPVAVDVGRVHYNRWTYVGGSDPDIATAYSRYPIEPELKSGGKTWFIGAGGPMGQMHAQRAVHLAQPPATLLCTARTPHRIADLEQTLAPAARERQIDFTCLSLSSPNYAERIAEIAGDGFDHIVVLAPSTTAIADAMAYLAPGGIINVFAGLKRGTMVSLDLSGVYQKDVRIIGHTASTIDDLRRMLQQTEAGQLAPNQSVKAIGSLEAARDGLMAVSDAKFPGKVVIFPQIKPFPLTPLAELQERLPSVYAQLKNGREWTVEAEQEFLRLMLP